MTREESVIVLQNCASMLHDGTRFFKPEHEQEFREAYEMAISALEEQDAPDTNVDTISRQAAIDAANRADYRGLLVEDVKKVTDEVVKELKQLPSIQPEIIRCNGCKWYELPSHKIYENCVRWMRSNCILLPIKPDDYCGYAERRTDSDGRD